MKKMFILMLALASVLTFASCGEDGAGSTDYNSAGGADNRGTEEGGGEIPEETGRENIPDAIPAGLKFDGKSFNIIFQSSRLYEVYTEEENGDIVNDAVYTRNKNIEERFGIEITATELADENAVNAAVRNSVNAGDYSYDLIYNFAHYFAPLAVEGILYNWKNVC